MRRLVALTLWSGHPIFINPAQVTTISPFFYEKEPLEGAHRAHSWVAFGQERVLCCETVIEAAGKLGFELEEHE